MYLATLVALVPALAVAAPQISTPLQNGPDPHTVQVRNVTYGGSVGTSISADLTKLTLIFDAYVASLGPGVPITETRKNCQLSIPIEYPGGFQYSVFSADYRGAAMIDAGVTGAIKSTYYFSGQQEQIDTETDFTGPYVGDYLKHDDADTFSSVWSPCGAEGMLNINSQARLTSSIACDMHTPERCPQGLLTTDSIDASFMQILYVQWRPCTADKA